MSFFDLNLNFHDELGECALCPRTDEQLQIDTDYCIMCYSAWHEGVKYALAMGVY